MSDVKMLGSWVFVKQLEEAQEGKVIVPDTAKEISQKGKVVNVRPGSRVKKNDKVLFKRREAYGGRGVELNGELLLVMKEDMILGTMNGDTAKDIVPLGENVLLQWEQAPDIYAGTGLIRPEAYKQMYFTGQVVAIGEKVNRESLDEGLRVGDRVFFDQFCGIERLQEDGKRYAFVKSWDVFCTGIPSREEMLKAAARR